MRFAVEHRQLRVQTPQKSSFFLVFFIFIYFSIEMILIFSVLSNFSCFTIGHIIK